MNKKGKFIVIDGIDGSGKATQAELLKNKLIEMGNLVELADFPQYGDKSASLVEMYLNGNFGTADEVGPYRGSIFYAVDRYAASFKIKEWLAEGKFVISNRYVSANKGHQTSKIRTLEERRKFIDWLNQLEYELFDIPIPDLTIFLHVPSDIGYALVLKKMERKYIKGKKQDIHEADKKHLKHAEKAYLELIEGGDPYENWIKIACSENDKILPVNIIAERIFDVVSDKVMEQAEAKGFGIKLEDVEVSEKMVNIHSEISDAYNAFLEENMSGKDGFYERIGDALQRVIHLAGIFKIQLFTENYNDNESCQISLDRTVAKLHKKTSDLWEAYRYDKKNEVELLIRELAYSLIKVSECYGFSLEEEIINKLKNNKKRIWPKEEMNEKFVEQKKIRTDVYDFNVR